MAYRLPVMLAWRLTGKLLDRFPDQCTLVHLDTVSKALHPDFFELHHQIRRQIERRFYQIDCWFSGLLAYRFTGLLAREKRILTHATQRRSFRSHWITPPPPCG